MKKLLPFLLLLTTWLPAQHISLENVLEHSVKSVEKDLPPGTRVAVLNFTSTSENFSNFVVEEISRRLEQGRQVIIVDRLNSALVKQMMNVRASANISERSVQTIGHMMGAQSVISGVLQDYGGFYRFIIKAVNTETGRIQTQYTFDLANDPQLAIFMGRRSVTALPPATISY